MQVEKIQTVQLFWSDQMSDTSGTVRAEASAVVIGAGVAGCSVAYHLARLGWTDVVVVDQHDLADGTTWHSAGFVGQLESRLVRIYRGYRGKELLGYAFIDVHTVRTMPEAFLVVLSPSGEVRTLRVLAFHEPLEYMPSARWYQQFEQKNLSAPLRLGGDVHGIVGATLSARATTAGVRRALALYQVVVSHAE